MKHYDRVLKLFFAEFFSLLGTAAYIQYSISNLKIFRLSLCTTDILASGISYNVFVSMEVWLCLFLFYEELINCFMSEQFVIRYEAKWKLYVRQACRILWSGIVVTGIYFLNFFIVSEIMGLELYTWSRSDSLFALHTKLLLTNNQNVGIIFMELFVNALLQFLYFVLIALIIRWFIKSKTGVILLTILIFIIEAAGRGFLLKKANVFKMFQTGAFNGVFLKQMFCIVILVTIVGWLASIRKEFYDEKN